MKVNIRPLQEQDAYTSVQWRNDPEVFKYTGNTYDHVIKIDTELEWIRRVIANPKDYRCAILVDGVYVGNIYLTDIEDGCATYHIFIGDKNYWGKGIAREASRQIIDYGFNELHLDKIVLEVRKLNERAVKLYKSIGFTPTGNDEEWIHMAICKESFMNKTSAEKV